METVIIVIHLMVVSALVALVLMQRSEGGALGIGGGGNFLATRSRGNVLTRTTGYLAAGFFATSIALTILARMNAPSSIMDLVPTTANGINTVNTSDRPTSGGILGLLPSSGGASTTAVDTPPAVPGDAGAPAVGNTPAADSPAAADAPALNAAPAADTPPVIPGG